MACSWIVHKWWFRLSIDTCILMNCGFLAAESPAQRGKEVFQIAEYAFTAIFVMEMVVKMIAFGKEGKFNSEIVLIPPSDDTSNDCTSPCSQILIFLILKKIFRKLEK